MPKQRAPDRVMGPYFDEKRSKWYVLVIVEGRRTRTACASEEEARDLKRDTEGTLQRPEEVTVGQAIEQWLEYQAVDKGNKPRSLARYRREIGQMFPKDERERPIRSVTPLRAEALYRAAVKRPVVCKERKDGTRREKPRAVATHQMELQAAKLFGSWCAGKGRLLKVDPFDKVEPIGGSPNRGKKKLREDEAIRFLDEAFAWAERGQIRAVAAAMALYMGMRVGEILSLRARSLQLGGTVCYVEEEGKTGERKYRVPNDPWPMRDVLLRLAANPLGEDGRLFPFKTHQHVLETVAEICAAAKLPRVTTQGLRATHEELGVEGGASPEVLAASLGHTRAVQQQHYVSASAYSAGTQARALTVLQGGKRAGIAPPKAPQEPAACDSPTEKEVVGSV